MMNETVYLRLYDEREMIEELIEEGREVPTPQLERLLIIIQLLETLRRENNEY